MAINLWIPRIEFNDVPFFGDITSGGFVVSNLTVDLANFQVGMYLGGSGVQTDTKILSKTPTTFTVDKAFTATEVQGGLDAFLRFDFTFPPSKDTNVDYKPNNSVIDSLNGRRQTQTNFIEATRQLEHWFLNESDASVLETDFYLNWACYGNQFRYFPDKADSAFLTCALDKPYPFSKPRQIKKHPGFLYLIKMNLRYVKEIPTTIRDHMLTEDGDTLTTEDGLEIAL